MYEMYPDTWHVSDDGHHDPAGRPRRRARKDHPVVPPALVAAGVGGVQDRPRPHA